MNELIMYFRTDARLFSEESLWNVLFSIFFPTRELLLNFMLACMRKKKTLHYTQYTQSIFHVECGL